MSNNLIESFEKIHFVIPPLRQITSSEIIYSIKGCIFLALRFMIEFN